MKDPKGRNYKVMPYACEDGPEGAEHRDVRSNPVDRQDENNSEKRP
jgi:hypothetical protein